jgi:apolipoprotein D and lipocalin family protein
MRGRAMRLRAGVALALSVVLAGCATPPAATSTAAPVRAVAQVDLQRYAGRWYEIAAYPMFFQRQCVGDTTADYTLRDDGRIDVLNRCRTTSGHAQARGVAWAVEDSRNARLKVSFFWPFRADYWVIGLADDYRWAVVGEPGRRYLWILARTPALSSADLESARAAARAQGYDLEPLRSTPHGG